MLGGSLKLQLPASRTLLLAAFFLIMLILFGEIVTRSTWFQTKLPVGEWGTDYRHVSTKLDQLKSFASRNGSVDCLFLGNSMVWRGIDPNIFTLAFHDQTGQSIQCFNFGIDGMSAAGAGALVNIFVDDFQPRFLLYGIDAYDLAVNPSAREPTVFTDMAWLRYRQGEFNLKGWLIETSCLYKSRKALYHILHFDFSNAFVNWDSWEDDGLPPTNGYEPYPNIKLSVTSPPDPDNEQGQVPFLYNLFSEFTIYPENASGLQAVISQSDKDLQVIVFQMPVSANYMYFFGEGSKDYERFIKLVKESTQTHRVTFLKTVPMASIPDEGWTDYNHLNTIGAEYFSQWLGEEFGKLIMEK